MKRGGGGGRMRKAISFPEKALEKEFGQKNFSRNSRKWTRGMFSGYSKGTSR